VSSRIPWRRFLVEGAVIVVSILFAFGIDAWWEERQERRVLIEFEERLRAQMAENRTFLDAENRRAAEAVTRLDAVAEAISPQPELMPSDSLVSFLTPGLMMQEVELEVSAVDGLLTSASFDLQARSDLYRLLVAFRARAERYGEVIPRFIEARARVYDRLYALSPWPPLIGPGTDFPINVTAVLSDHHLESLVGELRFRRVVREHYGQELIALADSIVATIGPQPTR
jgi:hypothetical protein